MPWVSESAPAGWTTFSVAAVHSPPSVSQRPHSRVLLEPGGTQPAHATGPSGAFKHADHRGRQVRAAPTWAAIWAGPRRCLQHRCTILRTTGCGVLFGECRGAREEASPIPIRAEPAVAIGPLP